MAGKASPNRTRVEQVDIEELIGEERKTPVIDFDARDDKGDEERIVIFHLNGKDYSVPKRPRMNFGLRFSYERRAYGTDVAVSNLMRNMIGAEGFESLMEYDGLTDSDIEAITEICSRAAMGKLEAQKAK